MQYAIHKFAATCKTIIKVIVTVTYLYDHDWVQYMLQL